MLVPIKTCVSNFPSLTWKIVIILIVTPFIHSSILPQNIDAPNAKLFYSKLALLYISLWFIRTPNPKRTRQSRLDPPNPEKKVYIESFLKKLTSMNWEVKISLIAKIFFSSLLSFQKIFSFKISYDCSMWLCIKLL